MRTNIVIDDRLMEEARQLEFRYSDSIAKVHPEYRASARNLVHYVALRHVDIRELQEQLRYLGLSSLGRAEQDVMSALQTVRNALSRISEGKEYDLDAGRRSLESSSQLVTRHSLDLLGSTVEGRDTRIMVTIPERSANDPDFVRGGHGLFSTLEDYCKFARMLLDGRSPAGETIISRKMLDMMTTNRIPPSQLPLKIGVSPLPGYGWGLGVRIMVDPGQSLSLTGKGEFGWAGAASTYFWVDPHEQMIGVTMSQYLGSILPLADDLRGAAYQMLH